MTEVPRTSYPAEDGDIGTDEVHAPSGPRGARDVASITVKRQKHSEVVFYHSKGGDGVKPDVMDCSD